MGWRTIRLPWCGGVPRGCAERSVAVAKPQAVCGSSVGKHGSFRKFLRGFQKFRGRILKFCGRIWGFRRGLPIFRGKASAFSCGVSTFWRNASASWRKVFVDGRVRDGACRRNRGGGSRAAPRRWHSTRGNAASATCRHTCRSWRAGPCRGHRRCGAGTMWRRG